MSNRLFRQRQELLEHVRRLEEEIRQNVLESGKFHTRAPVRIVKSGVEGVVSERSVDFDKESAWIVYEVQSESGYFDCRESELELK